MEDDFRIPCPLRDGVQRQGFVSSLWLDLGSISPKVKVEVCSVISHVQIFVTPWTVACQTPLSTNFPGKNTGLVCHFLLQGIFLTQELNPHLLDWQASHQGNPKSRSSSNYSNNPGVRCSEVWPPYY